MINCGYNYCSPSSHSKISCLHPEEVGITIHLAKGKVTGRVVFQDLYKIELSLLINKTILSLAILHMKLDLCTGQIVNLKTPDI